MIIEPEFKHRDTGIWMCRVTDPEGAQVDDRFDATIQNKVVPMRLVRSQEQVNKSTGEVMPSALFLCESVTYHAEDRLQLRKAA